VRLIIELCEYPVFDLIGAAVDAAEEPKLRIRPAAVAHAAATGETLTDVAVAVPHMIVFVVHWIFIGL
jgi:hypothetical protein